MKLAKIDKNVKQRTYSDDRCILLLFPDSNKRVMNTMIQHWKGLVW